MFITCNTYQEAPFTPDVFSSGTENTAISETISTAFNVIAGGGTNNRTQIWLPCHTIQQGIGYGTSSVVGNIPVGSVYTAENGSKRQTDVTTVQVTYPIAAAAVVTFTVSWTVSHSQITTAGGSIADLIGSSSTSSSVTNATTIAGSYTVTGPGLLTTRTGTDGFFNYTVTNTTSGTTASSTTQITASTLITSSHTGATSVSSTVTTTAATTHTIVSTGTTNSTRTIWKAAGGGVVEQTTATLTANFSKTTTETLNTPTTTQITAGKPTWYGWKSQIGTVLLATGNNINDDLPAWLEKSTAPTSIPAAFWNFSFTTQTTLWPANPVGVVNAIATSQVSQVSVAVSTLTIQSQQTLTLFGSSSFTFSTTTGSTAPTTSPAAFTNSDGEQFTTASVPLPVVTVVFTSFTTFTATYIDALIAPFNTITSITATNGPGGGPPDIATLILSNTTVNTSRGTFATVATVTTLTSGYTTALIGIAASIMSLASTTIITAPQIQVTTTTFAETWIRDSSSPTAIWNTTGGTSSTLGTTVIATTTTGPSTTSTTITNRTTLSESQSGIVENHTQNIFANTYAPFVEIYGLTTNSTTGGVTLSPGSVYWWAACPTMQGVSPWTDQSLTYKSISSPVAVTLGLAPFESGSVLRYDTQGRPITSTAWGLWGVIGNPVTERSTFTTTSGTSTVTSTITNVGGFTTSFSSETTATNGTTRDTRGISYPSDFDQAAATIFFSEAITFTTTTGTGASVTSSSSSATSYSGITYDSPVTQTFCESYAFLLGGVIVATVSTLTAFLTSFGTVPTTFNVITTTTLVSSTTFSSLSTPSNSSGPTPTTQIMPGVGGWPKITTGRGTIFAINAGVSLIGMNGTTTTTWSSASPGAFAVVLAASLTTTSSASTAGYPVYSIPGQASVISSPCSFLTTNGNAFIPCNTYPTRFWLVPDPVLGPRDTVQR